MISNFDYLPSDVLPLIFKELGPADLVTTSRVCKRFKRLAESEAGKQMLMRAMGDHMRAQLFFKSERTVHSHALYGNTLYLQRSSGILSYATVHSLSLRSGKEGGNLVPTDEPSGQVGAIGPVAVLGHRLLFGGEQSVINPPTQVHRVVQRDLLTQHSVTSHFLTGMPGHKKMKFVSDRASEMVAVSRGSEIFVLNREGKQLFQFDIGRYVEEAPNLVLIPATENRPPVLFAQFSTDETCRNTGGNFRFNILKAFRLVPNHKIFQ